MTSKKKMWTEEEIENKIARRTMIARGTIIVFLISIVVIVMLLLLTILLTNMKFAEIIKENQLTTDQILTEAGWTKECVEWEYINKNINIEKITENMKIIQGIETGLPACGYNIHTKQIECFIVKKFTKYTWLTPSISIEEFHIQQEQAKKTNLEITLWNTHTYQYRKLVCENKSLHWIYYNNMTNTLQEDECIKPAKLSCAKIFGGEGEATC